MFAIESYLMLKVQSFGMSARMSLHRVIDDFVPSHARPSSDSFSVHRRH